jgi:hypothetical protein
VNFKFQREVQYLIIIGFCHDATLLPDGVDNPAFERCRHLTFGKPDTTPATAPGSFEHNLRTEIITALLNGMQPHSLSTSLMLNTLPNALQQRDCVSSVGQFPKLSLHIFHRGHEVRGQSTVDQLLHKAGIPSPRRHLAEGNPDKLLTGDKPHRIAPDGMGKPRPTLLPVGKETPTGFPCEIHILYKDTIPFSTPQQRQPSKVGPQFAGRPRHSLARTVGSQCNVMTGIENVERHRLFCLKDGTKLKQNSYKISQYPCSLTLIIKFLPEFHEISITFAEKTRI